RASRSPRDRDGDDSQSSSRPQLWMRLGWTRITSSLKCGPNSFGPVRSSASPRMSTPRTFQGRTLTTSSTTSATFGFFSRLRHFLVPPNSCGRHL
ncbi:hypothetical protein STRTUCAR8_08526, partial [Streptomyces turgidiscabies Car8]